MLFIVFNLPYALGSSVTDSEQAYYDRTGFYPETCNWRLCIFKPRNMSLAKSTRQIVDKNDEMNNTVSPLFYLTLVACGMLVSTL
jgi:hypothetical protein